ncbi:hypothetical protein [Methanosarcina sp. UBA5]|nr:hypothetical protein [Methanosarcina sp. UBA5]
MPGTFMSGNSLVFDKGVKGAEPGSIGKSTINATLRLRVKGS